MPTGTRKSLLFNMRATPAFKRKLKRLADQVGKSQAAVVRAIVLRTRAEDLPAEWPRRDATNRAFLEEVES